MSNRINELMDEMGLTYKDVEYFTGIDSTWVYRLAKEDRESTIGQRAKRKYIVRRYQTVYLQPTYTYHV